MANMSEVCKHYGVTKLSACPPHAFIVPEFFPKGGLLWTLKRLDYLDLATRESVCNELRDVFLSKGAKAYGEHLLKRVRELGSTRNKDRIGKGSNNAAPLPQSMQNRVNRLASQGSRKKSILGMAEGAR